MYFTASYRNLCKIFRVFCPLSKFRILRNSANRASSHEVMNSLKQVLFNLISEFLPVQLDGTLFQGDSSAAVADLFLPNSQLEDCRILLFPFHMFDRCQMQHLHFPMFDFSRLFLAQVFFRVSWGIFTVNFLPSKSLIQKSDDAKQNESDANERNLSRWA